MSEERCEVNYDNWLTKLRVDVGEGGERCDSRKGRRSERVNE